MKIVYHIFQIMYLKISSIFQRDKRSFDTDFIIFCQKAKISIMSIERDTVHAYVRADPFATFPFRMFL